MNSKHDFLFLLAVTVFILEYIIIPCEASSTGAPSEACVTLIPQHGTATPQQTVNPYQIQVDTTQYAAGEAVTVTLTGSSSGFKGFLLQARRVGQSIPFGTWENLPSTTRAMSCQGLEADSVTHSNNQHKTSLTFTWRAPLTTGTVQFVATVVQSFAVFWGPFRSSEVTVSPSIICSPNPCLNGAQCIITSSITYRCACVAGTSGPLCASLEDACFSNPCQNGGQCTVTGSSYQCTCQAGFTGPRCMTRFIACSPNPCWNGGQCSLITGTSNYQCSCTVGYSGSRCQTTACSSSPCLNGGYCSLVTGTSNYQCSCSTGYSGTRCQTTACSSSPCLNGGYCSLVTGTSNYQCSCTTGYSGDRCQTDTGTCVPNPCFNSGECIPITGGVGYQCNCPSGFTGESCHQPLDPCSPNPCMNGGLCSSPFSTTFLCECADGWSGVDCSTQSQAVCAEADICLNGGTCEPNTGGSFTCRCAEGFDGVDCSNMISPCFPSPCLNGGTCIVSSESSFTCSCPASHSGITCQIEDMCDPSPCHSGVCQQMAGDPNYTCSCNVGYTGSNCDIQALCSPNPCVNGVCEQDDVTLTYSCQCDIGFMGENCDQIREVACVTNPCLNSGMCLALADGFSYECACPAGYTGALCDEAISPVFQNCPEFQILIYPLELGQDSANVTLVISATVAEVAEATVEVVSGPEIPGVIQYSEEYRPGKAVVMRATSATGTTAECNFVLRMIDEEPPTVDCPQDITKATYGASETIEWPAATATDNLAMPSDITILYSVNNGSVFMASEEASPNTIEVTAMDTFNNVGSCQFAVTVVKIPNAPLPVFTGCRDGDTVLYQLRNNTDIAYISLNIQAKDSSQQPAIITQLEGPQVNLPGDIKYTEAYRLGQKFVFRALDPVTELTSDYKQPPEIRCPPNIIERTTADSKAIFWPPVIVEDNLQLSDGDFIHYDPNNGTVFDAVGLSHIVYVTATDSFDNVGTCQFSVTLYKFDIVCSEFPTVANGSGDCIIAPDGKMECRVSCDTGYEYAPVDNRFKCQITSTKAFWDPMPNADACIRPVAGSAIGKTVTAVFPFDADVCDDTNGVFVSNIKTSIHSSLQEADVCEKGLAQACTPDSVVPKCGIIASGGTRKRRAFTDLSVDIKVTAPAANTQESSLSEVKQDVDDLAGSIKDLADTEQLSLIIDHEMVYSLTSMVSEEYVWICPEGYRHVSGGCVSCPPGTYFNTSTFQCMFCEQSYYQHLSGQTSCIQCDTGRSTDQMGSSSNSQCEFVKAPAALTWTPFLTSMVVVTIALILVLFIGALCICVCVPSNRDRHSTEETDESLNSLKYLSNAYEEEYTTRRSVGIHRLTKRQTSPSRASTGYITTSTDGHSNSHNLVDMVSIDSDDYCQGVHASPTHFNHGNTIKNDDSAPPYGHVSTAMSASSRHGFNSPSNIQKRELSDTGIL